MLPQPLYDGGERPKKWSKEAPLLHRDRYPLSTYILETRGKLVNHPTETGFGGQPRGDAERRNEWTCVQSEFSSSPRSFPIGAWAPLAPAMMASPRCSRGER